MDILQAMDDPNLFAPWFKDPTTWKAWKAFLSALFGLPMDEEQLATYRQCTGRVEPPAGPFDEGWMVCGRRAGKSFVMSLVGIYLATFKDYRPHLAPGERATVALVAADRKQARTLVRYMGAFLTQVPMLARMVEYDGRESFDLANRVTIEIHTASYKSTRGYTLAAAICDEVAFWPMEDSSKPDAEILAALRPGLASIPGSILLCASSPHARRGELWKAYRRYYGKDGAPVLVWQAPTRTMNPRIRSRTIDEAYEADPSRAAAEYGAQFRTDVETFLSVEVVEAAIEPGVRVRAPLAKTNYAAFVDPSGGAVDSMTMGVAHREGERVILDCLVERRAPFSPESVVAEFAGVLKSYGVRSVSGDRYAGEWPAEAFRRHAIEYLPSEVPKSGLYQGLLPLLTSGRAELLDEPRLITQLVGLERRTARGGRDSIDHAPNAHDDLANAVAGVLTMIGTKTRPATSVRELMI